MSLVSQIATVTAMNLRGIPSRFWVSLSTVVAVALAVSVLLGFQALGNGFRQTLQGTGSPDVAIFLRGGAVSEINSGVAREQIRLLEEAPGIARGADGKPLLSAELYVVVDGIKKSSQTKANLALRGIGPVGQDLRQGFRLVEGRLFAPGSAEIVVGRSLLKEFEGFELGKQVKLGTAVFTVVGVFDMGGSVFESEMWTDVTTLQSLFRRDNFFQSVRVKMAGPDSLAALKAFSDADVRLKLDVKSEQRYFADQAQQSALFIERLGIPLGIIMSIGALAGALNTMYSAVANRTREIATLRALGFGGTPAFVGTLSESLVLAALGGLVGAGLIFLFFDGATASTFGGSFTQVVFAFKLTPALILNGIVLALIVGLIGGLFPAIRAARVPLVAAFGDK